MNSIGYLTYVSEMLSTHDAVVIPGFGGFITTYKPARISEESGHIYPPTKYIAFNEKLDIHDNTFARFLDEKTSVHYSPRLFDHFIAGLKSDLSSNQVIVVPQVGRLYQDFDGVTHFMPDLLNLNNNTFGLPQVEVAKGDWVRSVIGQASQEIKNSGIRTALASAATVALLFMFVLGGSGVLDGLEDNRTAELSIIDAVTEKESPKEPAEAVITDDVVAPVIAEVEEAPVKPEEIAKPKEIIPEVVKEAIKPVATAAPRAIIVVGAFGSEANAAKMIKKMEALGYVGYQDRPSKLNRVGIEVSYTSEEELNSILATVQNDITSRAWILK